MLLSRPRRLRSCSSLRISSSSFLQRLMLFCNTPRSISARRSSLSSRSLISMLTLSLVVSDGKDSKSCFISSVRLTVASISACRSASIWRAVCSASLAPGRFACASSSARRSASNLRSSVTCRRTCWCDSSSYSSVAMALSMSASSFRSSCANALSCSVRSAYASASDACCKSSCA